MERFYGTYIVSEQKAHSGTILDFGLGIFDLKKNEISIPDVSPIGELPNEKFRI